MAEGGLETADRELDAAIGDAIRRAMAEVGPWGDDVVVDLTGDEPRLTIQAEAIQAEAIQPDPESADPYVVLGVDRRASWAQIVAARNQLLRTWHPDAGGDAERLMRLNAAYAELRIRRDR